MSVLQRPIAPAKASVGPALLPAQHQATCWRIPKRSAENRGHAQVARGYAYAEPATESAALNSDADDYYSILGVVRAAL